MVDKSFIQKPKDVSYTEGTMLVDVRYYKNPECFEVVYLDPVTKKVEVNYEEAYITIWFLKEEYRTNKYQIPQAEKDKMYPVQCKPSQIAAMIAKHIGGEWQKIYDESKEYMKAHELKSKMCECPWVFGADFLPDVYYRLKWIQKYSDKGSDITAVTFGMLDIETDVLDRMIDLRKIDEAPQPVNAVTVILPNDKICAVLVLGPRPRSKLHERYWGLLENQEKEFAWLLTHQEEFKRRIIDEDPDNKKWLEGYDIRLHIFDFEDEINLIKTVFDYINKYRPMFTLSWNAKFDDNYLVARIKYLGYDPLDIVIPNEFHTKMLYYSADQTATAFKTSKDWMFCSSYTTYVCQMRLFAAIRKSQQERRSYSLSSVGKDTAKIDKLTNTKSGSFRTFAYSDFLLFILYNIRDVVVQVAIELINNDCQALVGRSYMFCTQYSKCFQETHIVRNTREFYYEADGFVQACRLLIEPGIDPAYKGAFVAETLNNAPTGYILNGKNINNVMFGVLDADAKAYYPSTKIGLNEDPATLLFKSIIDNDNFRNGNCTNRSFNQEYYWYDSKNRPHAEDMSAPIMNSYKNHNEASVMHNWLGAPSMTSYFEFLDNTLGA